MGQKPRPGSTKSNVSFHSLPASAMADAGPSKHRKQTAPQSHALIRESRKQARKNRRKGRRG